MLNLVTAAFVVLTVSSTNTAIQSHDSVTETAASKERDVHQSIVSARREIVKHAQKCPKGQEVAYCLLARCNVCGRNHKKGVVNLKDDHMYCPEVASFSITRQDELSSNITLSWKNSRPQMCRYKDSRHCDDILKKGFHLKSKRKDADFCFRLMLVVDNKVVGAASHMVSVSVHEWKFDEPDNKNSKINQVQNAPGSSPGTPQSTSADESEQSTSVWVYVGGAVAMIGFCGALYFILAT